jgi:putative MATE family efflux protein
MSTYNVIDGNVTRLMQSSIGKALFKLSLPIVLSNTFYTSHQLINAFWVGRLGAGAIAAVSVSFPVVILLVSLAGGLTVAGSLLVAQYAGSRDHIAITHVSAQTLLTVLTISILLSAIGYAFVDQILYLMGVGADISKDAAQYMKVSFTGTVFMFSFALFQAILRAVGEVKIPMYVIASSVVLNLILDPLFIFGFWVVPPGGVVGAAYATLVTQGLAAFVGLRILFSSHHTVRLKIRDFVPDFVLVKRVFLLGLPASIEQSTGAFSMTLFTALVSHFGTVAVAAYGIGCRVLMLVIIPAFGISMATATLVGHSVGVGDLERAKKIAVESTWCAFWLLTAAAVVVFIAAPPIVRILTSKDAAVIGEGIFVVRCMSVCFGMTGIQFSLMGALRGAGDTFAPMVIALVSVCVVQVPVAYYLSNHTSLGERGLWYSLPISAMATTVLATMLFKRHNWKRQG